MVLRIAPHEVWILEVSDCRFLSSGTEVEVSAGSINMALSLINSSMRGPMLDMVPVPHRIEF